MALPDAALRRPPLDAAALTARLVRPGGLCREIRVTGETGSTNADLLREARAGAAEGLVLVAETQSAGRGRLGRSWSSPPRAALACSVLLRPAAVPPPARAWLPLLTGIAVAAALRAEAGVPAGAEMAERRSRGGPEDRRDPRRGSRRRDRGGHRAQRHAHRSRAARARLDLAAPGGRGLPGPGAAADGRAHRAGGPLQDLGRRPGAAGPPQAPCARSTCAGASRSAGRSGWSCPPGRRSPARRPT